MHLFEDIARNLPKDLKSILDQLEANLHQEEKKQLKNNLKMEHLHPKKHSLLPVRERLPLPLNCLHQHQMLVDHLINGPLDHLVEVHQGKKV
jgi:hypothetical protein